MVSRKQQPALWPVCPQSHARFLHGMACVPYDCCGARASSTLPSERPTQPLALVWPQGKAQDVYDAASMGHAEALRTLLDGKARTDYADSNTVSERSRPFPPAREASTTGGRTVGRFCREWSATGSGPTWVACGGGTVVWSHRGSCDKRCLGMSFHGY